MPKQERRAIQFDDGEDGRFHAVWSRSGKHLIVTVTTQRWGETKQVELRPDQLQGLCDFLSETIAQAPSDR